MPTPGLWLSTGAGGQPQPPPLAVPGNPLKNQQARELSHSTLYLQRGFQGRACGAPGSVCRGAGRGSPGRGQTGGFALSPGGLWRDKRTGAAPLAPRSLYRTRLSEEGSPGGGTAAPEGAAGVRCWFPRAPQSAW